LIGRSHGRGSPFCGYKLAFAIVLLIPGLALAQSLTLSDAMARAVAMNPALRGGNT
jgi:hypothetical protein